MKLKILSHLGPHRSLTIYPQYERTILRPLVTPGLTRCSVLIFPLGPCSITGTLITEDTQFSTFYYVLV